MKADIEVEVDPDDERLYYDDAYKQLAKPARTGNVSTNETLAGTTNRPSRPPP
jgi:hypothetical protein